MTLPLPEGPAWNSGAHSIVVIDTETSGLHQEQGARVVEVAAVRFEKRGDAWEIVSHNAEIVLPESGFVMPAEATAINGITQAMVNEGRTFSDVWSETVSLCDGNVVIAAYNADFDRGHLRAEVKRLGISKDDIPEAIKAPWLDPLVWVRARDRFVKGPKRHTLGVTCARWGIPLTEAHRAVGDATATGKLLLSPKMAETIATGCFHPNPTLNHVLYCQLHLGDHQEQERREYVAKLAKSTPLPAPATHETTCSSCGAPIVWGITEAGKRMPLDKTPHEKGNVVMVDGACLVLSGEALALARKDELLISHFATCPNAQKHRR